MERAYDSKYSIKNGFTLNSMSDMLKERDIEKLKHWLTYGEPNKHLAKSALHLFVQMEWIEAINLLITSNWIAQKKIITYGFLSLVTLNDKKYPLSESFFVLNAFNSKILSKSEKNNLRLSCIDMAWYYISDHHWNIIFDYDMTFKGDKSKSVCRTAISSILSEIYDKNRRITSEEKLKYHYRFELIINLKNGFLIDQLDLLHLKSINTKESIKLFNNIVNSSGFKTN